MSKQEQLGKLNKEISECSKCILRSTCNRVVPGEGGTEAELMFIGEGPGQREDELGRPFVGAAGKFLDELLQSINVKREEAYIANVIKCRPPSNRDPFPEETEACWPWLQKQIEVINPKVIVILGKHSLERFFPGKKISQIHGKALRRSSPELGTRIFYALYHPAAALYNGSMREVLIEDFRHIPKVLEAAKNSKGSPIVSDLEKEIERENKQNSLF